MKDESLEFFSVLVRHFGGQLLLVVVIPKSVSRAALSLLNIAWITSACSWIRARTIFSGSATVGYTFLWNKNTDSFLSSTSDQHTHLKQLEFLQKCNCFTLYICRRFSQISLKNLIEKQFGLSVFLRPDFKVFAANIRQIIYQSTEQTANLLPKDVNIVENFMLRVP